MSDDPEVKEVHVGLTKAELAEEILKVKNELAEEHSKHTAAANARADALEVELKALKDADAARKKAEDDAAKAKGGGGTMVTPPASMPASQPNTPEHEGGGNHQEQHGEGQTKKPGLFKRLW